MPRWYYKCPDCLAAIAVDADKRVFAGRVIARPAIENPICGGCGAELELMGEVSGPAKWVKREHLCKCDHRCTCATGPNCDCSCGGENHGAGMLGSIEQVVETGRVRISPPDKVKSAAAAQGYRAALESARARIASLPGHAAYCDRRWVSESDYWAIRSAYGALSRAKALRTHKGRLAALARVAAQEAIA